MIKYSVYELDYEFWYIKPYGWDYELKDLKEIQRIPIKDFWC